MDAPTIALATLLAVGVAALLEALVSLREGLRFRREFRRAKTGRAHGSATAAEHATDPVEDRKAVCLVVPLRGVDPGLEANLAAFFRLDHPDYRLVLVVDAQDDPAVRVVHRVRDAHPAVESELVVAGAARDRGQKVHNLLAALATLRPTDRILAFGDSDVRPAPGWLADLVDGLDRPGVGAATGFRWYLPTGRSFASRLRAAWNAGIASMLRVDDSPFAWGGATAIRRETFEACRVAEVWDGALSDDFALSHAVRGRGLKIAFRPRCLSFSHEDCDLEGLLRWTARQLAIARVYRPRIWGFALLAQTINSGTIWGGALAVIAAVIAGRGGSLVWTLAGVAAAVYVLGIVKAWLRVEAVGDLHPEARPALRRDLAVHLLAGPLSSLVTLYGLVRAEIDWTIEWRGIRYRMVSPRETEVLSRRRPNSLRRPEGG